MSKPIRVFYSELSGRFYATTAYRQNKDNTTTVTGKKFDVTNDIGHAITTHKVTFKKINSEKKKKINRVRIQRLPGDTVITKSES